MRNVSKKTAALVASLVLVLTIAVGGTLAFLAATDGPLKNTFNPSKVTTKVDEDIITDPEVKQNVKIQNTGDTAAWIRAAVVVTWQDASGNVYGAAPVAGTEYEMTLNTDGKDGWLLGEDGFYYWYLPVEPGETTGVLIESCKYLDNAPEDYFLNVEIIGSGIQSVPGRVYEEVWFPSSGIGLLSGELNPDLE